MGETIFLRSGREGEPINKEAKADAAITPGMVIERSSTGVKKKANAGDNAVASFAIEDSLQGNEISDDYSAGDRVQFIDCAPGDEVLAWLAQGENVSIGDFLESAGGGLLQKYTTQSISSGEGQETFYPKAIICQALEALNLSSSGDEATRIKVLVV